MIYPEAFAESGGHSIQRLRDKPPVFPLIWAPGRPNGGAQPQTTPKFSSGTTATSARWSAEAREIHTYRAAGFTGTLQLVMPGDGAAPLVYQRALAAHLVSVPGDRYHTMNTGAVWQKVLPSLPDTSHTEVNISTVGDGSGEPRNNPGQPGDDLVPLATADPTVSGWSDSRWLTFLAHLRHLPVIGDVPAIRQPPTSRQS